jgi:DNA-binding CsgD family transcriptional regulator
MGQLRNATGLVAEMARSIPSRRRFRAEIMSLLERCIGFSDCMFHDMDPNIPVERGIFMTDVPLPLIAETISRWARLYSPELAPLWAVAARRGGVVVDTDVLGPTRRSRLRFYGEMVSQMGIDHFMWCHLHMHGEVVGSIALARRGAGFVEREGDTLRGLFSVLAIAEACYRATARPLAEAVHERLTPREREIVDLVVRGLTNGEAATVLGLSLHTVRNHLNTIFRKLEVASRAELAGLAAGAPPR